MCKDLLAFQSILPTGSDNHFVYGSRSETLFFYYIKTEICHTLYDICFSVLLQDLGIDKFRNFANSQYCHNAWFSALKLSARVADWTPLWHHAKCCQVLQVPTNLRRVTLTQSSKTKECIITIKSCNEDFRKEKKLIFFRIWIFWSVSVSCF
jgi:hypothetical protein